MREGPGAALSTNARDLAAVLAEARPVAPQTRRRLGHALRRLGHDVSGPVGALRLEVDSVRYVAGRLDSVVRAGDTAAAAALAADLTEAADNLAAVQAAISDLVLELRRVGHSWTDDGAEEWPS